MPSIITLIGMPSAGKTTIAEALAKSLGYEWMDLDHMVEAREGESLISVLEKKGASYFLDMQYGFLKDIPHGTKVVISPAGSIIYHEEAMKWFKENGKLIFLDTELPIIKKRLESKPKAIVGLKEKGLDKLWEERIPVYKTWADAEVQTSDKSIDYIIKEINTLLHV